MMDIIREFKMDELPKNKGKILDLLPNIEKRDLHILESWERDFRARGIPHYVTKTGGRWQLWKERRV